MIQFMEDFWRTVTKDKENIRFLQPCSFSPYSEISLNGIKTDSNGITWITVNGFYRYDSIMQPLFGKEGITVGQKNMLFDIYMHYLTELEYRTGVTCQEYLIRRLWSELENGSYGEDLCEIFNRLGNKEKYIIAHALQRQQRIGESVELFSDVLVSVLGTGIVYKNAINEKELLLYAGKKKNDNDTAVLTLIRKLFKPLDYELYIFWDYHFAVFGEKQTMAVDEIELL